MAEVEERQRLAEELLLTPEMRKANEIMRKERSRESGPAQVRPAETMLISQEPRRWLLAAAAFAVFAITYSLYAFMEMRVSHRATLPQLAHQVPVVASNEPPLPSAHVSDDFVPSFTHMSAMFHGVNFSSAATLSKRQASISAGVQSTKAQLTSAYKMFWHQSSLDARLSTPVSLAPHACTAPSGLMSAVQKKGWSTWGTGGLRHSANSVERLHSFMALSSSAVPAPDEFMDIWVCIMGAGLVLSILVLALKSLLGCGQHQALGIAPGSPFGLDEAADFLPDSKTPMYTPGMVDCQDSPRVSDAARQIFLRSQTKVAELEQGRAENARKLAQLRQMIGFVEEGMQRAGEGERAVRSRNSDLQKQNERLARKLDLARSHIDMLKRENEGLRNGDCPLDAVSFHGPTLAQAQPTVLRNLDSLLDHTNDREGSPSGLVSPPPHSPTPAAINTGSPGVSIVSHAIPAEDQSSQDPDSNESDASNTATPTAISTQPSSMTPPKSDFSLGAPTFRPLASSPLRLSSKAYHTDSQGCKLPRSTRSIRGRRALHAVVQPLSFSPNLNTDAADDEDEMVLGTTPALPPASPNAQSTFLSRDTSTISATVGSPNRTMAGVRSRLQALASPASSDSNTSEQPPPLLMDKQTPCAS